jgi:hypothetical protein
MDSGFYYSNFLGLFCNFARLKGYEVTRVEGKQGNEINNLGDLSGPMKIKPVGGLRLPKVLKNMI